MNLPAEQLMRDYLNRVSVAARARLSPDDRRAFLARVGELIEQNTRGTGPVAPTGVARFLNGLGDPATLVAREHDRLAAQQPDTQPDTSLSADAAGTAAARALRYAIARARQHPLVAIAIVLLGLGAAYPPVWLLGAAVAGASRTWDARDKWLGLAAPVLAVIVGTGADISLGGARPDLGEYVRDAWLFGGHLSRVVAVLGALYLAWRSQRPHSPQLAEPWKKQRRFS
ncbi:MAG: hypothetical protein ACRDNZ_00550 [Streptosporangiaceae bacterium]